jgi:hypothetical protein
MSKATEVKDLQLTSDEAKQLEDAFQVSARSTNNASGAIVPIFIHSLLMVNPG